MFTQPTVFVIGAGASQPYGLPLGGELKQKILERYRESGPRFRLLLDNTGFASHQIGQFVDALRYSGLGSVDAFLERRPEFIDIGKAAMGIELLYAEVSDRLWQPDNNWLAYLYGYMVGSSLEEFANNKVGFITFNYDRCIEQFTFHSLRHSFGKLPQETASVLQKIPVVHLHGKLGDLPWQLNRRNVVDFGDNQIDPKKLEAVSRAIKVVHEDHTLDGRDDDFKRAEVMLVQARRVYMLGFGFGARNVQRLKLDLVKPYVYSGTAFGLTERERSDCAKLCGGKVNLWPAECLDFMRNFVDFS